MAKVFISHSWKDNDIARKIAQSLKEDGAEIWIDYARIKPGEGMPDRIGEALEWCDTLVLVWSKNAAESYYVKLEWQCALDMQKKIIPCVVDEAKRPPILRGFLYIDFKDFDRGYEKLLNALDLRRAKQFRPSVQPPEKEIVVRKASGKKVLKRLLLPIVLVVVSVIGIYFLFIHDWGDRSDQVNKKSSARQTAQDSLKVFWQIAQARMDSAYQHSMQIDGNSSITANIKRQAWQKFLTDFRANNPNSQDDNDQRSNASARLIYWRDLARQDSIKFAEKTRWDQEQSEMNRAFQQAQRIDNNSHLSAVAKAREWQDFLDNYTRDNPNTEQDNDQRTTAIQRRNYWQNKPPEKPKEITINGIKMLLISGDTFAMGDNIGDGESDEQPVHTVKVSDFYLGKTEVTVGQFRKFIEETNYRTDAEKEGWAYTWTGSKWDQVNGASWRKPGFTQNDDHPVVCVSWNDAFAFCEWAGGRLPSEAEWEFACRAGTTTPFNTGANLTTDQANYDGNYPYKNYPKGKYIGKTVPVGSYPPNAWGLYDMHGNVWEWCQDKWHDNYQGAPTNGIAWETGNSSSRLLRGGAWLSIAGNCRSANRNSGDPENRNDDNGFRLAFVP